MPASAWPSGWLSRLRGALPRGRSLPDEVWRPRQRAILAILWLHVAGLAALALAHGGNPEALAGVGLVALVAVPASTRYGSRRWRSALASLGLLLASVLLVRLEGGAIELQFHFFVVIALIMLYQDGFLFLIAVGFVVAYYGAVGWLEAAGTYPPPVAWANPWQRAAVDEALLLAAAVANLASWRLNEDSQARAESSYRQLYEGQRAVVRELQQSQHLKDELYNVVSHELRTPLTGILGFGELLLVRDGQLSPAQRKDHLGRILREARRLQRVVDNLVYSSKVIRQDGGAATDVGAVVHAVIEDLDDLPGRDRVELEVRVPAGLQATLTPEAFRLVLVNLLGNALKYATPGTTVFVSAWIEVGAGAGRAGDRLAVAVSNAGQPIPPADRERIFQPFVQLDSSTTRTASGVGLGLHIVRRLVESFGGTVEVDSDVAGMVTFTVRVPMASRRSDPARLGGSPSSHLRSSGGSI
ncbi:MAG TPA: HAMP domain-containing sensor histidine kinase [Actinomycetota bacterium]